MLKISKQIDSNIIENLKDIKCFPIFTSTEISQPKNKKTYIIGDAFFAFPPTFAQGASQSIYTSHQEKEPCMTGVQSSNKELLQIDRDSACAACLDACF